MRFRDRSSRALWFSAIPGGQSEWKGVGLRVRTIPREGLGRLVGRELGLDGANGLRGAIRCAAGVAAGKSHRQMGRMLRGLARARRSCWRMGVAPGAVCCVVWRGPGCALVWTDCVLGFSPVVRDANGPLWREWAGSGRGRREVAPPNGAGAPWTRLREAVLLARGALAMGWRRWRGLLSGHLRGRSLQWMRRWRFGLWRPGPGWGGG